MALRRHVRETAAALRSDGRGRILAAVAIGWFLSLGVRLVFPAVLEFLRADFDLSLTAAGVLLSVLWAAYAVGQLPGGIAGDRVGEGRTLVASTALAGVAAALVAVATTPSILFVATAAFGLTTALYGPTRYTILSNVYDRNAGAAVGATLAAGNVGNAVLPAVAGVLAAAASWRLGFGLVVPLFAVTAVAIAWAVPARTSGPTSAVDELSPAAARRVLDGIADGPTLLAAAILLFNAFVWQGFTGFYPTYLVVEKGLEPRSAALLFGGFFATGVVVQPLAGAVSDRAGARRTLLVIVAVIVSSLAALPFVTHPVGLVGVTALLGSLLGTTPVAHTYLTAQLPAAVQGTGLGVLRTAYMLVGATGPALVGAFADADWFDEAFLVLAAVAGAALACVVLLPSSDGRGSTVD